MVDVANTEADSTMLHLIHYESLGAPFLIHCFYLLKTGSQCREEY